MKRILVILACVLMPCAGFSQYFGEQVMEKSFEQADFFFTPYRFVPFGIGTFKNSVAGVLDDPLVNLDVNPSYLYRDSLQSSYLYVDFRSAKEIRDERDFYYPHPILAVRTVEVASFIPYPRFYINTRRELEPVLSAAYLFSPVSGSLKNLSLGITYQMVSQDEEYYPIPQDIYKTVLGSDYRGMVSEAAANIPIVDRYSGTDNIHQSGHFVSLFAGYQVDPGLQIGVKAGRVSFDRDGAFGSQNFWENYYSGSNSTSLWRNGEARQQTYGHWEMMGGINYTIAEEYNVGVTGGYLWGDADQVLTRNDSSYYSYGPIGSTTQNWNVWSHAGNQRQTWNHDGKTSLLGAHVRAAVSSSQRLQLHYQYGRQNTDIALAGTIADTSFGRSRYQWDTTISNYSSNYALADRRNGLGTSSADAHRVVASMQWDINDRVRLSFGAQYENRIVETSTSENVIASRFSRWMSTGSYAYNSFDSTAEAKTLEWNFRSKLTRFTIPIFFTVRTSDKIELLFGLNRSAATWQVDDVTLAIFKYRVQANQEGTTRKENFGERYTQPREKVSDTRTTLMAGLTVSPSRVFNMRFLVVPNFVDTYTGSELQDLQWWISVSLMP